MIALFSFFHQRQVFIQHFLFRESNTINTSQHLTVFMATPVCTCHRSQFDSLDRSSSQQVRTTAKISKSSLRIGSNMTVFQFGYQFAFVGFTTITKHFQSIGFCNVCTNHSLFLCHQLCHFSFNSRQISFFDHSFTRINIIVKTILNSRPNTKLYAWIKFLQCLCQQVSTCMPESMFTFLVLPFIKYDRSIFINRAT